MRMMNEDDGGGGGGGGDDIKHANIVAKTVLETDERRHAGF